MALTDDGCLPVSLQQTTDEQRAKSIAAKGMRQITVFHDYLLHDDSEDLIRQRASTSPTACQRVSTAVTVSRPAVRSDDVRVTSNPIPPLAPPGHAMCEAPI